MTDNALIGPISVTAGYIFESDEPGNGDGTEKFDIICTQQQAIQIKGLVTPVNKTRYGNRYYINFDDPNWGLIPLDAAIDLADNDYINYRGIGYILIDAQIKSESPKLTTVTLTVEKILGNLTDYLQMDYTTGINDGTELTNDYPESVATTLFQDDFADAIDTVNDWYALVKGTGYDGTMASSGGKLACTGGADVDRVGSGMFLCTRPRFTAPFTVVADLERTTLPPSGRTVNYSFNLQPITPVTWTDFYNPRVRISLNIGSTSVAYYVQKYVGGSWITAKTGTLTAAQTAPNFKVTVNANRTMDVWMDAAGGTAWTQIVSNYDISDVGGSTYNLIFAHQSSSSSDRTARTANVAVTAYTSTALDPVNVVSLPVSTVVTTADFTRGSEDGNIPCYANPTGELKYTTTSSNFYKGTVKAYTTNYGDSTSRLITGRDQIITPTKFYVANGIIKLTTTATGVTLSAWTGAAYTDINTFVIGTINVLKVIECSPMRFTFQANNTRWTLEMGKPYARVVHPTTDLSYTLKTCYYHDSTTSTSPGAAADITMLTLPYCYVWDKGAGTCAVPNPADNNRLLILKQNMETIKSDSIPASNLTGIGWVLATEAASSHKDAIGISQEFFYKTRQAIITGD